MILDFFAPLIGWAGLGSMTVAGALAVAWFFPPLRRLALEVAAIAAVATVLYWMGDRNGATRIQEKWDAAVARAIEEGAKARSDAESDVAADPDGKLHDDPYNRDR